MLAPQHWKFPGPVICFNMLAFPLCFRCHLSRGNFHCSVMASIKPSHCLQMSSISSPDASTRGWRPPGSMLNHWAMVVRQELSFCFCACTYLPIHPALGTEQLYCDRSKCTPWFSTSGFAQAAPTTTYQRPCPLSMLPLWHCSDPTICGSHSSLPEKINVPLPAHSCYTMNKKSNTNEFLPSLLDGLYFPLPFP